MHVRVKRQQQTHKQTTHAHIEIKMHLILCQLDGRLTLESFCKRTDLSPYLNMDAFKDYGLGPIGLCLVPGGGGGWSGGVLVPTMPVCVC